MVYVSPNMSYEDKKGRFVFLEDTSLGLLNEE